ncbi:hypothetical protein MMC30_002881 [Trapelia coarctata]|nr:hypothetical protein [Trapelia coarctata]
MEITAGLSDQLITSVTGISVQKDGARFKSLQRLVHSVIYNSKAARTNPFAVNNHLEGLEEKFRVLNNDELANALDKRLAELSNRTTQWTPEILSLLVQLSENPAQRTKLEDLDLLEEPAPPPPLTWAQILLDDPLDNDEGLWDDVNFEAGSSEDGVEFTPDLSPSLRPISVSSSLEDPTISDSKEALEVPIDSELLRYITEAQYWKSQKASAGENGGQILVTETQVIREVVFMLLGLPTNMFQSKDAVHIDFSSKYRIQRTSTAALEHILTSLAVVGQGLAALRNWVISSQEIPMVQTLQSGLSEKLHGFDTALSKIEAEVLNPADRAPMTLLRVHEEIRTAARLLLLLVPILADDKEHAMDRPFKLLESLHNLVCTNESKLDGSAFSFFAELFLHCFRTYLKPIRRWMEDGELDEDDGVFFVKRNKSDAALTCLWSKQYKLVKDDCGHLYAPQFLHVAAQKIFNTGKSVSFVHSLGFHEKSHDLHIPREPPLDFQSLCVEGNSDGLSPFSESFAAALEKWIASKHVSSSSRLRELMGSRCGFWSALDALEYVYLSRNGALTSQVASSIFDRIDGGSRNWKDRFVLTELFRRAYGQINCVNGEQMAVHTTANNNDGQASRNISMAALTGIHITYKIPWAVANIIKPNSLSTYERVAILILQMLRAKQLLEQKLPVSILTNSQQLKSTFATICSMRHRQLWLVNSLHSYLSTVLARASSELRAAMERAADFDEMIAVHEDYITHLENKCLLSGTLASTHQAIVSLLDLAIVFSDTYKAWNVTNSADKKVSTKAHRRHTSTSSEDEDSNAREEPAHLERDDVHREQLIKISSTFDRLFDFVIAGLREASRSGVEPSRGMLVDSLALWDRS